MSSSSAFSDSGGADDSEDEYGAAMDDSGAAGPGGDASRVEWKVRLQRS